MMLKHLSAAVLALAMTVSPGVPADREEAPANELEILFGPGGGGYETVVSINGEGVEACDYSYSIPGWGTKRVSVELGDLPKAPTGYVPMRAIAQADHGSAYWSEEENMSRFNLGGNLLYVYFDDMSVFLDEEKMEGVSALLIRGVTYLPVSVIDALDGFSVTDNSADGAESYEISTPNGQPLMKTAYQVIKDSAMLQGGRQSFEQLEEWYGEAIGFQAAFATEGVAFTPINIFPDTLILGKMAPGQEEALRESMEAYRVNKEQTFSWYMGQHLPKVQNARFVTEDDWFMFLIAEDADAGVETFRAAVRDME